MHVLLVRQASMPFDQGAAACKQPKRCTCVLARPTLVPLNSRCSKKCAVPLVASVSKRLPLLIHMPTVVVSAKGMTSVATRRPLGSTVTCTAAAKQMCYTVCRGFRDQGSSVGNVGDGIRTFVSGMEDSRGL